MHHLFTIIEVLVADKRQRLVQEAAEARLAKAARRSRPDSGKDAIGDERISTTPFTTAAVVHVNREPYCRSDVPSGVR